MNEIEVRGRPQPVTSLDPDEQLSETARRRIHESVPASTRRAYAGDWRRFTLWCTDNQRSHLPATAATLAEYVSHLADQGKAASTIERAMAAIAVAHSSADLAAPHTRPARAVLRRHRAELADGGRAVRKAKALTVTALRAMVDTLDVATLAGARDRALIVVGFALGARRSELAALNIADLTFTDDGLQVTIRRSKTDKDSLGRATALPYTSRPATCPVRNMQAWLDTLATLGETSGPVFRRIDRHGNLGRAPHGRGEANGRITGQAVAIIVRRTALRAGLDAASAFSGHSLRRGFATETHRRGKNPLRIARHGGWKDGSATLAGYIEDADQWEDNALTDVGL
ncbi:MULTISPECIES: tyrosine-type recombinase/integrase [Micromonospora]|uniref:Integrase n=1 Tax=Micromonospora sicca TaxID=2202420 RepID=A0A317CX83_9ACTN|nr:MULTISPECIES: tyrosine-type recombinase/integrase [unclassified Micromonospora]MBM0224796.1 tyrosine-type recombinase/integrase [Micromonospora sp. ATA51]PWR06744.1 integrase [Micromonospora sp. 4G51]